MEDPWEMAEDPWRIAEGMGHASVFEEDHRGTARQNLEEGLWVPTSISRGLCAALVDNFSETTTSSFKITTLKTLKTLPNKHSSSLNNNNIHLAS
jgi:hypothetical protein